MLAISVMAIGTAIVCQSARGDFGNGAVGNPVLADQSAMLVGRKAKESWFLFRYPLHPLPMGPV